jgi:outer membrane receptor protein involved in Fe transport
VGYKTQAFNRRVSLQASAYWINWNDIQQSVYLSGCGYGYIANLGKAISRGVDLQADWSPERSLSFSLAAGYTDAFNAQDSLLDGTLLAKNGDPLATPKWTAALSAEYRFTPFAGANGYARVDYQYADAYFREGSTEVFGVIPLIREAPSTQTVSARLGVRRGRVEAALYGENLADAHTSLYQTIDSIDTTPQALRGTRLKPRTLGLSVSYSF